MSLKTYTILAGKRRAKCTFKPIFGRRYSMERMVKIHKGSIYQSNHFLNNGDVSKIYGFSNGFHMNNSARLGARYDLNKRQWEFIAFFHQSGHIMDTETDFSNMSLGPAVEDRWYYTFVETYGDEAHIAVIDIFGGESEPRIKFGYNMGQTFWGYELGTYIGGDEPSMRDITISLDSDVKKYLLEAEKLIK